MRGRGFLLAGLLTALLVAGVASHYASAHPDGLEHVAEETGFGHAAEDSPTADSPLADYATEGVGDPRLSVGIAGVTGSLSVLLLAGGLFWLLRRREPDATDEVADHPAADPTGRHDPADSRR